MQKEIIVRYRLWLPIVFVVAGIIAAILNIVAESLEIAIPLHYYLPAAICLLFGIQYFRSPYVIVSGDKVVVVSLFGISHRVHKISGFDDLVDKGSHVGLSNAKFVRISKFFARKEDYKSLLMQIEKHGVSQEIHDV